MNLIINWMLIPKYQANGAAFGTIVAEFSVMLVQMVAVKNELPMRKYIMSYSPILIIGLTMAVLVDRIGIKLGVSISTLAYSNSRWRILFCIATIGLFAN